MALILQAVARYRNLTPGQYQLSDQVKSEFIIVENGYVCLGRINHHKQEIIKNQFFPFSLFFMQITILLTSVLLAHEYKVITWTVSKYGRLQLFQTLCQPQQPQPPCGKQLTGTADAALLWRRVWSRPLKHDVLSLFLKLLKPAYGNFENVSPIGSLPIPLLAFLPQQGPAQRGHT